MKDLFKDKTRQEKFEKDGFVKVDLLASDELAFLLEYYQTKDFDNKIEAGFHISLDNQDQGLVNEVFNTLKQKFEAQSEKLFKDYKVFTASYVVKEPGKQNIVPPHQDWTFVDEQEYCSATVWIPLMDVTENNGALAVIKGSHKLFNHYRSSPSPQSKSPLSDHIFTLFPYTEVIEMKAGEALVFDNRLIHASPPNLSDKPRIAVGIGITNEEAQLKHYYQNPNEENQLEEYEVSPDFFNYFNNKRLSNLFDAGELPSDLKQIRSVKREVPELSKEEMEALVKQLEGVSYNRPFMERLAALFNYTPEGEKKTEQEMDKKEEKPKVEEKKETTQETGSNHWDERTFFQKYTPANIVKEIIWRMKGRP